MRATGILVLISAVFLAAFWWQRARSGFLAVEARAEQARELARRHDLATAEIMALWELLGAKLNVEQLNAQAADFARDRAALGDIGLAAMSVAGERDLVQSTLRDAGGDSRRARQLIAPRAEAITAVRFEAMVERFASRGHD